jgi:hypothetical protein
MAPEVGPPQTASAPREIDGRPVLLIYSSVAGISPEERVANIEKRILGKARRNAVARAVEFVRAEDHGDWTEITVGSDVIMGIMESAAKAAARPRAQIGAEYAKIIRRKVTTYRQEHTCRALLRAIQPDYHRGLRACLAGAFPYLPSHPTSAGQTLPERSAS